MHVTRERLRDEVLLPYLRGRRWFAAKNDEDRHDRASTCWRRGRPPAATWHIAFVDGAMLAGSGEPRSATSCRSRSTGRRATTTRSSATVRSRSPRCATRTAWASFYAAFANPRFRARHGARHGARARTCRSGPGELRFSSTAAPAPACGCDRRRKCARPRSSRATPRSFFGNRLFLKGYRRLRAGVNPELELGRFLTEVVALPAYRAGRGRRGIFRAMAPRNPSRSPCCRSSSRTRATCGRSPASTSGAHARRRPGRRRRERPPPRTARPGFHLGRMALLGRRVAEMHRALAKPSGDPAFDPSPSPPGTSGAGRARSRAELDEDLRGGRGSPAAAAPSRCALTRRAVAAARASTCAAACATLEAASTAW